MSDPSSADRSSVTTLFDPEFVETLERFAAMDLPMLRGHVRGERSTRVRGVGLEYAEYRAYQPGDDVRHIDWNASSRLDRLLLKIYAADEDRRLSVALDTSASMGLVSPERFRFACQVAAALAYVGLRRSDRVGLFSFSESLGPSLPPQKTGVRLSELLSFLSGLTCAGRTRMDTVGRALAQGPRGAVAIITDLVPVADLSRGLLALQQRNHEVTIVCLPTADELNPAVRGVLQLDDVERGTSIEVTVDDRMANAYQVRLEEYFNQVRAECARYGARYYCAPPDTSLFAVVTGYLRNRHEEHRDGMRHGP